MSRSRGKKLETEIGRMLLADPGIAYYYRPVDVPPSQRARFTSRSPIDFYCYQRGGAGLVIECKAMKTKSLAFSRIPKAPDECTDKERRTYQWDALNYCFSGGVSTAVVVNYYGFSGRNGQRGRVWFVPFVYLVRFRTQTLNRKSWPLAYIEQVGTELEKIAGSWKYEEGK